MRLLKGPRDLWPPGFYVLWDAELLAQVAAPPAVLSVRAFTRMARGWPETLPLDGKRGLVVAGLDGCLDALAPEDAEEWAGADLGGALRGFQDAYPDQHALVLWLPRGRERLRMDNDTGDYRWRSSAAPDAEEIGLACALFGGAYRDLQRVVVSHEPHPDADGEAFKGLYLRRLS